MKKDLICIAQARVIGGRKKLPHICSIAFDENAERLVRVCLPFDSSENMPVRRWTRFSPHVEQTASDTRIDSFFIDMNYDIPWKPGKPSRKLHEKLLALACPEDNLIEQGLTIGIKKVDSVKVYFHKLDEKHIRHRHNMSSKYGLWYPSKLLSIKGRDMLTQAGYSRLLLDWSFAETMRKELKRKPENEVKKDIRNRLENYKHPYLVCGTTLQRRKNFMAISVLSSPFSYG